MHDLKKWGNIVNMLYIYQAFILAKYNGSIFELTQIFYQDAGGQVDQGQRGVHHVGVRVVSLFALFYIGF